MANAFALDLVKLTHEADRKSWSLYEALRHGGLVNDARVEIAKIDGPLQDDAAAALGKIGDRSALGTLAELQGTASKEMQPAIAAAICLMGSNCTAHIGYLEKTLGFADTYPGYQDLLRGAATGLGLAAVAKVLGLQFPGGAYSPD